MTITSRVSGGIRLFVDALRGRGGSPTEGPLTSAILLLAIPMVLEMVMESVFAVVDIFFVSKLGANAVAAVGLTESLMTMVYTVAMGLSIGVTATVARRIGERDGEAASTFCHRILSPWLMHSAPKACGSTISRRLARP